MSVDEDFALALALQNETEFQYFKKPDNIPNKRPSEKSSLADPAWELVDPTPDIIAMFIAFDMKFFWGKLKSVVIRWSKRMYSCAGICSYSGRCGLCTISLSEPLLKLRPRKDLVETLLHEMIHAYLFVTHNNRDRSGHGPEFHKHMYRINAEAGVNITVYHSFHDEVNHYKTHWWRCNGPCRSRAPYFGTVKRSSNRAPGPKDLWWSEHLKTCGGTWEKVKEPENVRKKQVAPVKENNIHQLGNIQNYFDKGNQGLKSNRGSTLVVTKPPQVKTKTVTNKKPDQNLITTYINKTNNNKTDNTIIRPFNNTTGNLINVKGFKDLNSESSVKPIVPFMGAGNNLSAAAKNEFGGNDNVMQAVRNHWQNKFDNLESKKNDKNKKRKMTDNFNIEDKKEVKKVITEKKLSNTIENPIIVIDDEDENLVEVNCPVCGKKVPENDINSHLDSCIAQDFTTNQGLKSEFSKDFVPDPCSSTNRRIKCPLCNILIEKDELSNHLEMCVNADFGREVNSFNKVENPDIGNKIKSAGHSNDNLVKTPKSEDCMKNNDLQNVINIIHHIDQDYWNTSVNTQSFETTDTNDDESYLGDLITNDEEIPDNFPCPSCFRTLKLNEMNSHLDSCLSQF